MPVKLKRGRWSKDEVKYMTEKAGKIPVEDMARRLNRDIATVKLWIRENLAVDVSETIAVPLVETEMRNELRTTPEWQELRDQFLDTELKLFEYKYGQFMAQFKLSGEVLPTERVQIFLLIKLDILMNRNLKDRQRAVIDVQRTEHTIDDMYNENGHNVNDWDSADQDRLSNLERQLTAAREAQTHMTTEYLKLSEKHSAIMKDLKATRDQRFSKLENSKNQNFLGLIKALQDEELRKQEGEDMELMRLALENEKNRLSQSHRYVDDTIDQPLLTPENIGD